MLPIFIQINAMPVGPPRGDTKSGSKMPKFVLILRIYIIGYWIGIFDVLLTAIRFVPCTVCLGILVQYHMPLGFTQLWVIKKMPSFLQQR